MLCLIGVLDFDLVSEFFSRVVILEKIRFCVAFVLLLIVQIVKSKSDFL